MGRRPLSIQLLTFKIRVVSPNELTELSAGASAAATANSRRQKVDYEYRLNEVNKQRTTRVSSIKI